MGSFQRSFTFPVDVQDVGLKATLKNGVLRIVVLKKSHTMSHGTAVDVSVL